ncbi:MAG: TonB-dependent receptor [Melioribacteraceae bacterium]|nr:TonB-dependent receptor [Melioribacteraceae bacterium]
MLNKLAFLSLSFFFTTTLLNAQNTTLSGFITDSETGEELISSNVFIVELGAGTTSNEYGFYSITIPKGNYTIYYSFMGYKKETLTIDLNYSVSKNVELTPDSYEMDEVIVEGKRGDQNVKSTEMGTTEIVPKEMQAVPVILGEADILKTLQLLPGISQAGDGNSGFFVRGGNIDQNLILLDEATVYNPSHLFGFFSVFNSDAIKNAKIIKGSMPAEYGGRISSVLDIKMKEGNNKEYRFTGGIGLISSRLSVEGPIVKDKSSFLISGRRTYADIFIPLAGDEALSNTELYFYDLNLKANYKFSNSDKIFLSGYFGRDVLGYQDRFGFNWGNISGTLRWNHLFSEKLFSNTSLIFSDYDYTVQILAGDNDFEVTSGIRDINFKTDFQYFHNSENSFRFGFIGFYHTFLPGEINSIGENINSYKVPNKYGVEMAAYISHETDLTHRLKLNYGLRYSGYLNMGPGTEYVFDSNNLAIDSTTYESGEIINSYGGFEPRISATYLLSETSSVKGSYTRNYQYIHLLSTSTTATPIDVWLPTTTIVKPEIANQVSLGYFKNFNENQYETSVEVYYKNMENQIDYENGANIYFNEQIESQLVFGTGYAYGVELYIKKNFGDLTGWVSYTLSKTEREFDEINDGKPYSARQDRTHDFSITGIYKFNKWWTFSANWVYYTGDAVTFPSGKYVVDGNTLNLYTERNGYRMPDYHRLDVGATMILSKSKTSEMSLTFSLFNAYNRKNAYTITFQESEVNPQNTEAVRLALFGVIPSITFNFSF